MSFLKLVERSDEKREELVVPWVMGSSLPQQYLTYLVDGVQRSFLFWDVLRQRGDNYLLQQETEEPNVLLFDSELISDGRDLTPPVNYRLLHIRPPAGTAMDPSQKPIIVFDPRAGQGAGIGGFKKDSEVGLALANGHPVYFVSFLVHPVPGQTIEDVCAACTSFVQDVMERHPKSEKPCLIGNCQAGWLIALMASLKPQIAGSLILAGAPLSYWRGRRGESPARYTAGISGGSWPNAFLSDLGGGLFDGAWLVQAFEMGNPANTYWKKLYDLYSSVDTGAKRFLDFERWWGTPVLMTGDEMQFIADELFVGNRLTQGKIHFYDGKRVDLRNVKAPIVVFCSKGDDITPPEQALGWLLDLYACDDDVIAHEQTVIYSLHDHIGHLGLFVSDSVVSKEHLKFISNVDMIESLPPGLYEAKFLPKSEAFAHADLASGDYVMRFEKRSLEDVRLLAGSDQDDDLCFEAVARLSDNLQGLYYSFISPFIRQMVTKDSAELMRQWHPLRLAFSCLSSRHSVLSALVPLADTVRAKRQPLDDGNIFWAMQSAFSQQMEAYLSQTAKLSGSVIEGLFYQTYGNPLLQAMLGLRTVRPYERPGIERDVQKEEDRRERLLLLMQRIEEGGLIEAMVRGLLYVSRAIHAIDERAFRMLHYLRQQSTLLPDMSRSDYHALARQQNMMLVLDEEKAVRAIPFLLGRAIPAETQQALEIIERVFEVVGPLHAEEEHRLARLRALFNVSDITSMKQ